MHVHSTFSDGKGRIEDNIAAAEALGLTALGCVDHVRATPTGCPSTSRPSARLRGETAVELRCGIEAKLLDTTRRARPARTASRASTPSTPPTIRCRWPKDRRIRARCASASRPATSTAEAVIDAILTSTARALDRPAAGRDRALREHPAEDRAERGRPARRRARPRWPPRPRGPARRSRSPSAGAAPRRRRCARSCATACRSCSPPTATAARRSGATSTASPSARARLSRVNVSSGSSRRSSSPGRSRCWPGATSSLLAGPAPLPPPRARDARARAERGRGRAGLERGGRDRAHDRHAAGARLPARAAAGLRRRRRQHRRDAGRRAGRRPPSTRAGSSTCAASKGGEGKAHTLNHGLRADPRRGLVRGGADHRRRRDLHRAARCAGWCAISAIPRSAP